MGILDALLGKDNPFSQFADNNSNTLGAIGSGLAAGPTFSQGLSNAAQAIPQAKALDQQAAQAIQTQNATVQYLKAKYPDLADAVQQGLPVQTAWAQALQRQAQDAKMQSADPTTTYQGRLQVGQQQGLTGNDLKTFALTSKLPGSNQSTRAGVGQPIFGKNKKTGSIVPFEPMTDGTAVNLIDKNDAASNYDFDPATVAFQRASGTTQGKVAGGVQAALPIAAQTAQNALDTIAKLRDDKAGQSQSFGTYGVGPIQIPDKYGPTFAQTPKADFQALLQQAGGQAFLQAYSTLRGAGAISDTEGQKAGAAISRMMNPDISQDAFNAALDDYEAIIKAGYSRIQQQAAQTGADPASMPQLAAPAAAPDIQSLLDKYK